MRKSSTTGATVDISDQTGSVAADRMTTGNPLGNEDHTPNPVTNKRRQAHIAHQISGRIRMKIPSGKADPEILEKYRHAFSSVQGTTAVHAMADTGSIVIHYDPRHEQAFQQQFQQFCAEHFSVPRPRIGDEVEEIVKQFEAEAEFLAERSHFLRMTVDTFKTLDYQIRVLTGNTIDLKIVLAGGLAVATFAQIGAETATPMWVTLALFTVNHFVELHHEGLASTRQSEGEKPSGSKR
jgi:hypothetical protein